MLSFLLFLVGLCSSHQSLVTASDTCTLSDYKLPSGIVSPSPLATEPALSVFAALAALSRSIATKSETPLAIRALSLHDGALWNCVAAYDDSKLDIFRMERPVVVVPETLSCEENTVSVHTTEARALCMLHVSAAILPTIAPHSVQSLQGAIASLQAFGTDPLSVGIDADVQACNTPEVDRASFKACVEIVAADNIYSPRIIGSILAQDTILYALNDGWNMDGTDNGACEYNCRPFADTTGYEPKNLGVGIGSRTIGSLYSKMTDGASFIAKST